MSLLTGKAAVEHVQRKLKAAGLYAGDIDGVWGEGSDKGLDAALSRPAAADAGEPLIADLRRDEGERLKPYKDTVGKLTIGVGRNLDDVGISATESAYLLANDVARTDAELRRRAPWAFTLDPVRRDVVRNMGFNLGVPGLLEFRRTLGSVQAHDYALAADQMLQSRWAEQVGARARRLAEMMRTGRRA